jgi:hypothetical protein
MKFIKKLFSYSIPVYLAAAIIISSYFTVKYSYLYLFLYPEYKTSYIKYVKSNVYNNDLLNSLLDIFDSYGYNSIIKHEGKRPIYIIDGKLKPPTIGQAWVYPGWCLIQLSSHLSFAQLRLVLYHELIHCYGYDHTKFKGDLMYPILDEYDPPTEENVIGWAKTLCDFINGRENCK